MFFSCVTLRIIHARCRIYAHEILLPLRPLAHVLPFQHFPSLFFVYILKPVAFFFPRGCRQPLSKSLDSDWRPFSPFGATTWEKRRAKVPLVFHVEAAARASSPIRGTFSANRSENFAVSDVCNWQIILMVILDEMCHRQPHEFYSVMHDIWCCHIDTNQTYWDTRLPINIRNI